MTTIFAPLAQTPAPTRSWRNVLKNEKALANLLRGRRMVNYGAFGVVYRVENVAVKIGRIGSKEAEIQQWVCDEFGLALPVWASAQEVFVPRVVSREVCPKHGFPRELWASSDSVNCHCGKSMGVLVMPIAQPANVSYDSLPPFVRKIENAVYEAFRVSIDLRPANFLKYKCRIVMCDFGDISEALESLR
ncbi:MAG: hypothetical protein HYR70_04495 [Chloroflexi bacterium]|nr:hypothetical protein [Chloroflexota bacterium]MBI3340816.1 hypothetical protein [Chloroflexota bacterium]